MEKKRLSHKWTSDETILFCGILTDPVNNFMETVQTGALKRHSTMNYLIPLLLNLKKARKMLSSKEKISKNFKAKKEETKLVAEVKVFP